LTKQTRNSKLTKTEQSDPLVPDPIPIKEVQENRTGTKPLLFGGINSSINDLQIQYDDSPVNAMSHFSSQGEEIINRLNNRSVLESFYRMNADVEGVELDDVGQDVFSRIGFSRGGKPGQFNPPSVTLKKSKVSMETLNLMKKHL